jgi:hypothetical protein
MANADALLSKGPEIAKTNVLANKVVEGSESKTAGLGVGLSVRLTAKPDKVQAVKEFLIVRCLLYSVDKSFTLVDRARCPW